MSRDRREERHDPQVGPATPARDRAALIERRDSLCRRLEAGYAKIERGLAEGRDVGTWEDLWIELLREYERICDDLDQAEDLAA